MSSMFCKKIYQCKNADWCARDFNPKSDGAPKCFEPMTNDDRIRRMSDKELAEWLTFVETKILEKQPKLERAALKADWLDWLKQEVESDA